jgi:hypothetical protein
VPSRRKPDESGHDAPVERRQQTRGSVDTMTWEAKVLKRVERHVESLSARQIAQADTSNGHGWEAASILALRRRVGHRELE